MKLKIKETFGRIVNWLKGGTYIMTNDIVKIQGGTGAMVGVRATSTDSTGDLAVGVDPTGVNHGLYSFTLNKWLLHVEGSAVYLDGKDTANVLSTESDTPFLGNIGTIAYSSTTSWTKVGTINIPHVGIYRIRAAYSNAAVRGLAISGPSATQIYQAVILAEHSTGGTVDVLVPIDSTGNVAIWTVCNAADKNNNVQVYSWVVPER